MITDPIGHTPARTTPAEDARASFVNFYDTANTRDAYALDLRLLFQWCADVGLDPFAVTRLDLEAFVRHLIDKRGNSAVTVARRMSAVRRFYALSAADGLISGDPARLVRIPRRSSPQQGALSLGPSREELAALLAAGRRSRPIDAALVALMAMMGLRVSEACGLAVGDAQHHEDGHRVLKFVGKGGREATAPIAIPVGRYLDVAIGDRTAEPLLMRPGYGPLNRVAAARIVDRLARTAGIDRKVTPHDLRRGYISGMLDAGASLRDAQTAARHADPRMTMLYDRARFSLDRSANYLLATYIAGAA